MPCGDCASASTSWTDRAPRYLGRSTSLISTASIISTAKWPVLRWRWPARSTPRRPSSSKTSARPATKPRRFRCSCRCATRWKSRRRYPRLARAGDYPGVQIQMLSQRGFFVIRFRGANVLQEIRLRLTVFDVDDQRVVVGVRRKLLTVFLLVALFEHEKIEMRAQVFDRIFIFFLVDRHVERRH